MDKESWIFINLLQQQTYSYSYQTNLILSSKYIPSHPLNKDH